MKTLEIAKCYANKAEQAKSRGKEFAMSFTYFANLKAQTHCAYSGVEFEESGDNSFSFERLNNAIGYVDGNVITVARELNRVRSDLETVKDVYDKIEMHKASIESRIKACNSSKAKIGCLKKRISDANETPTYELRDKLVIPAWGHKQWRSAHTHALGIARDTKATEAAIEENKSHIDKWTRSTSRHAKSKIKNIGTAIEAQQKRLEAMEKESHKYDGFIGRLTTRACKVKVLSPKVQEWTSDLNTTTKTLEATLKNIESTKALIDKLELVAIGLEKFENLGKMDKYRVQLGLPLNTPLSVLLKNKMAYNLINKI